MVSDRHRNNPWSARMHRNHRYDSQKNVQGLQVPQDDGNTERQAVPDVADGLRFERGEALKNFVLDRIELRNFKGARSLDIDLGVRTEISGANASGKTTVFDSFCWVLFGKDSSGSEKFEIRTLGKDGKPVDNTEILVSATISNGMEQHIFTKTQKQKWVKKRGSTAPTFQGNVNSYEVDGYPMSETDYKKAVAGMVSEDIFKLITNPQAFPNMPWKEQRKILVSLFGDMTNESIATELGGYEPIMADLKVAKSTDDIQKKYSKTLSTLKRQLEEIPIRIDTLNSQITDADVEALQAKRKELTEKASTLRDAQAADDTADKRRKLLEERIELQRKANEIQKKGEEAQYEKRRKEAEKSLELGRQVTDLDRAAADKRREIHSMTLKAQAEEDSVNRLKDSWRSEKTAKPDFDKPAEICPTCGQRLTEKQIADNMKRYYDKLTAWQEKHDAKIKQITYDGKQASANVKQYREEIKALQGELTAAEVELKKTEKLYASAKKKVSEIPAEWTPTKTYLALVEKIKSKTEEIEALKSAQPDNQDSERKISELLEVIRQVDVEIGKAQMNEEYKAQIAELTEEQKAVAQKIANTEMIVDMVQDFVRRKMELIGSKVNGLFNGVNFRLFDVQINGGIKEVCECTVNGVPYGSLNNGHRIVAGLEIIRALQQVYGVKAPIFIDNAEAINDFNIPKLDSQMILLKVTDDDKLTVK